MGIQLRERLGQRAAGPYEWLSGETGLKWVYKTNLDLDQDTKRRMFQAEGESPS